MQTLTRRGGSRCVAVGRLPLPLRNARAGVGYRLQGGREPLNRRVRPVPWLSNRSGTIFPLTAPRLPRSGHLSAASECKRPRGGGPCFRDQGERSYMRLHPANHPLAPSVSRATPIWRSMFRRAEGGEPRVGSRAPGRDISSPSSRFPAPWSVRELRASSESYDHFSRPRGRRTPGRTDRSSRGQVSKRSFEAHPSNGRTDDEFDTHGAVSGKSCGRTRGCEFGDVCGGADARPGGACNIFGRDCRCDRGAGGCRRAQARRSP
jgi:hypothetical protein